MTGLERLGREIAREQDALPGRDKERAWVRARLLAMKLPSRAPSPRARLLLVAATLSLVASLVLLVAAFRNKSPLTVKVGREGVAVSVGTWIHAPENEPMPLAFSDGTRIEMAATSRARVLVLEPHDARVLLESGRMRVEVARRADQHFSIATGPFTVRVTGTRFDVSFSPERDRFELVLEEGQVELLGCVFGAGRKLVAGQRVEASCKEQRLDVAYSSATTAKMEPAPASAAASAVDAATEPEPARVLEKALPPAAAGSDAPSAKADAPAPRVWLKLARQGQYNEAFAAADAEGFESESGSVAAGELLLLADAARHAGQLGKAKSALTTLRRRFPGAKEAGLAAFSLGLVEFDGAGAYAKAAEWFRTYLRESPSGGLAREARGRLMEAVHRSGGAKEARDLALTYLLDYPAGPHAELARRLVASPSVGAAP